MKFNARKDGSTELLDFNPSTTAAIVCDMWDKHWCRGATRRVAEMAPRMNELLKYLRSQGVKIIHSPSETMEFYKDFSGKKIIDGQEPLPINDNSALEATFGVFPLDSSDGGCDCEPHCPGYYPGCWKRQIDTLDILEGDLLGDSSNVIYYLLRNGFENVIMLGVHTNMCIVGRPFGLKALVSNGIKPVLMRDLSDTMYNHEKPPYVNHFDGNELCFEFIEKYICPTVTSDEFLGGKPFRFAEDRRQVSV